MTPLELFRLLGEPLRWFAKASGGVCGGTSTTPASLARVQRNLRTWNLYVTLNPTRPPRGWKARTADTQLWRWVLVDLDPLSTPAPFPSLLPALGSLLGTGSDVPEAWILDSGRGFQLWLPLDPLVILDREHAAYLESITSNFLRILSGEVHLNTHVIDTSCRDLARLARMPGTVNQKTGRESVFIRAGNGGRIDPAALLSLPIPSGEREQVPPTSFANLAAILPWISVRAARFLTEGVFTPGRHSAAYAAAASLRDLSTPISQALPWVAGGALRCSPPLSPTEAARCTRSAYGVSNAY